MLLFNYLNQEYSIGSAQDDNLSSSQKKIADLFLLKSHLNRLNFLTTVFLNEQEKSIKNRQLGEIRVLKYELNLIFKILFKGERSNQLNIYLLKTRSIYKENWEDNKQYLSYQGQSNIERSRAILNLKTVFAEISDLVDLSVQSMEQEGRESKSLIHSEIIRNKKNIIAFVLLLVIFLWSLSLELIGSILRPLGNLLNLTNMVTTKNRMPNEKELDVITDQGTNTELSTLGYSFKKMILNLTKTQEDLKSAIKVKSEFLANMSHEIRTPMNGVLGMIQLLNETNLDKKQREMLATTQSCGESLLTILNDVLHISKTESGHIKLEKLDFDLNKCINDSVALFSPKSKEKDVELIYKTSPDPILVSGDVTRIKQILINLISNAVKFTHKGSMAVILKISESEVKEYINVSIDVVDSGIGIPEKFHSEIFKPFSQAESSTTREYGGSGLGLSICHNLVNLMGGNISFKSVEGKGTTFSLALDLKKASNIVAFQQKYNVEEISFHLFSEQYPHNILVAEDNLVNQKVIQMTLKKLGYSVTLANNGEEALSLLRMNDSGPFTIIFMDLQMPKMDGIQATVEILNHLGDDAPPIVALTANVFEEDRENCKNAGMSDFLTKPVNIQVIKEILIKYAPDLNIKKIS